MSKVKYIYESHFDGSLFYTEEKLSNEQLRCLICGDSNWLICEAKCKDDIIKCFTCEDPDDCCYDMDYICEFANSIDWEDDV